METKIFLKSENGYFGEGEFKFGGCFVPETLRPALKELQEAYEQIFPTKRFQKKLKSLYKTFIGRPTPLIYAKNASKILGNRIYLKFEGLANTGAHKINNALAQVLLAKKMGKTHILAETGAGQHGVAVASACAFLKMPCTIFMGEVDVQRQRPNVFIMEQFGAKVVSVMGGSRTLKDAVNEALRSWSMNPHEYFYVLGSALGPYPYPDIVRDSQAIIGKEIRKQIRKALVKKSSITKLLPDYVIACVGGGSNAMGAFSAFLEDTEVKLVGIEAGGTNFQAHKHAMRLSEESDASIGVVHGYKSYFLQDKHGQIAHTHSISAGLDYAGVGPQLAHLAHTKRVQFMGASDMQALEALQFFAKHEGILPALESSHALAGVIKIAQNEKDKIIIAHVSGRGDKDIFITAKHLCASEWKEFLVSEVERVNAAIKKQNNKQRRIQEQNMASQHMLESNNKNETLYAEFEQLGHDDLSFLDISTCKEGERQVVDNFNKQISNSSKEVQKEVVISEIKQFASVGFDPLKFLQADDGVGELDGEMHKESLGVGSHQSLKFLQEEQKDQ